ncbi:protein bicaudal C-like [Hetaerina americana]|uniref:protein bicaudal C-like n=1 Tax=Hetaerina americana TaxID=62018 RepID=UPI003A7F2E04
MGALDSADQAEDFFNTIMETTNTVIDWPRRLKIGAKTRKETPSVLEVLRPKQQAKCDVKLLSGILYGSEEGVTHRWVMPPSVTDASSGSNVTHAGKIYSLLDPYVRISGNPFDVKQAKEKVLAVLDPKGSLTIMKIDICYTDHSHIIGKGGQTIQRVKEETGCHIHFPDSNRSNISEKSNQVSIAGEIEGVEQARQQLRMLTPVKFSFELPAMSPLNVSPYPVSQAVAMVQERYGVHVLLRKGPRLFSNVVIVKGSEVELLKTETATRVLMQNLCDSAEGEVPVQMTMEISPHHHSIIRGVNSCNLKTIMMQTSTVIIFPDATDPNLPPIKKSTVMINGSIHNVYLAKQRLVGSLPLVLRFDVWEEQHLGIERCNKIMQLLDVKISARFKPKYGTYSVCVKGLERNAGNLYKARQLLLNSSEPATQAKIPLTYLGQETLHNSTEIALQNIVEEVAPSSDSSLTLHTLSTLPNGSSREPSFVHTSNQMTSTVSPISKELDSGVVTLDCESTQSEPEEPKNLSFGSGLLPLLRNMCNRSKYGNWEGEDNSPMSSSRSSLASPTGRHVHSSRSICFQATDSGYGETCESESSRPVSGSSMVEAWQQEDNIKSESTKRLRYESMKPLAVKAMQDQPDSSRLRVPNTFWSGFGFSHSMPGSVLKTCGLPPQISKPQDTGVQGLGEQLHLPLAYNICQATVPVPTPSQTMDTKTASFRLEGGINDIISLLENLGLERYSYIFTSEELDMDTFMTLDDNDLRELGVSTYSARAKILRAISEMRKCYFSGDAATGAESRSGTASHWNGYGF